MVSSHHKAGLVEIETEWSIDDLAHAHDVLDAIESCERKRAAKDKRQ